MCRAVREGIEMRQSVEEFMPAEGGYSELASQPAGAGCCLSRS